MRFRPADILSSSWRQAGAKRWRRCARSQWTLFSSISPDIDGYEVLEETSTDFELRNIPVLMVSAIEDIKRVVRCIELGATDYLTKPFNPVLSTARIDNCIE
jgi:adenylate cyclase